MPRVVTSFIESLRSPEALKRNWTGPLVGAGIAFVSSLILFVVIAGVYYALTPAGQRPGGSANVIELGGLLFFLAQRVAATVTAPVPIFGSIGGKLVFAPLGGLVIVALLLRLGGSVAARRQEGTARQKIQAAARMAVLFALLSFIASFVFRISSTFPGEGQVSLAASHVGAFFLPLLWGLIFGPLGAARRVFGKSWWRGRVEHLDARHATATAALRGLAAGVKTAVLLLLLGGAAVLAVAIARHPHTAEQIVTSPRADATIVLTFLLLVPNAAIMAFTASMGGSIRESASAFGGAHPGSIGLFGGSGSAAGQVHVPIYWLLALIIPALAALRMGFVAARAAPEGRGHGLRAALEAGAVFTLLVWLLERVSGGFVTVAGSFGVALGPAPATAVLLPVVWSMVGSWLGARVYLRRNSRVAAVPVALAPPASQPGPSPPGVVFCTECGAANASSDLTCRACGHPMAVD